MESDSHTKLPDGKVYASPTKKFFMTMLTRDIELRDAIFDLLDNCVDGVHRSEKKKGGFSYAGYRCELIIEKDKFLLKDNCGGIPLSVAKNYAFKMGREDEYVEDKDLQTVGMYGIGMKRAIFKMGNQATILSKNGKDQFSVIIPKDWSKNIDWYFDLDSNIDLSHVLSYDGTSIEIGDIHNGINKQFDDAAGFLQDLRNSIKYHYGYIIEQGFEINLNGIPVDKIEINILTSDSDNSSIKPYVYKAKHGTVDVEILIGFYRPPATSEELKSELSGMMAKSTSENAGITLICNDRVVLFKDKTQITGWGENPVPQYHTQFINITGVVHFRSETPIDLPVTTTKRGIDTSSPLYPIVRSKIREGLKAFTSFTNRWKKPTKERDEIFNHLKPINVLVPGQSSNPLITLGRRRGVEGEFQIPDLPKPKSNIESSVVLINFKRERDKIDRISRYNGLGDLHPNQIGEWCFDEMLSLAE